MDWTTPNWSAAELEAARGEVAEGRRPMTTELMVQIVMSSASGCFPWEEWEEIGTHRKWAVAPWLAIAEPAWLGVVWELLSTQTAEDEEDLLGLFAYDLVDRFPAEGTPFFGRVLRDTPPAERSGFPYRFAIGMLGDADLPDTLAWLEPLVGDPSLDCEAVAELGTALAVSRDPRAGSVLATLRASPQWSFPERGEVDRRIEEILAAKPSRDPVRA